MLLGLIPLQFLTFFPCSIYFVHWLCVMGNFFSRPIYFVSFTLIGIFFRLGAFCSLIFFKIFSVLSFIHRFDQIIVFHISWKFCSCNFLFFFSFFLDLTFSSPFLPSCFQWLKFSLPSLVFYWWACFWGFIWILKFFIYNFPQFDFSLLLPSIFMPWTVFFISFHCLFCFQMYQ